MWNKDCSEKVETVKGWGLSYRAGKKQNKDPGPRWVIAMQGAEGCGQPGNRQPGRAQSGDQDDCGCYKRKELQESGLPEL